MNMQNRNNYTPDVLDCLANLSNDEVFTPPTVVNQMLDMLPQEVFMSKDTTFLDPFTKSGVFLREITKRLLENQIPDYKKTSDEIEIITKEAIQNAVRSGSLDLDDKDYEDKARRIGDAALKSHPDANKYLNFEIDLQDALDHILKNQVFGIAITELTAQLARRSLYCSKDASSRYSVANVVFGANSDGNIRFEPMKHTWDKVNQNGTAQSGASCKYCGASASNLDRPDDLESHAYEFIHKDIADIRKEFNNMEFTVVCGNPPYQLSDGGNESSATPIYNKFIEQGKRLNPKYLLMIIPSRWMQGGKGLDAFRSTMMSDERISHLVDYEDATMCFPSNVHIDGGVCYFLWDSCHSGTMSHVFHNNKGEVIETERLLKSDLSDVVIRDYREISILDKIKSVTQNFMSDCVSSRKPYGIAKDLFNSPERYPLANIQDNPYANSVHIYGVKGHKGGAKRMDAYVNRCIINDNTSIDKYKLFFTTSYSSNAVIPPEPIKAGPNDVCTETFLTMGSFDTEQEMNNCFDYVHTTFFRALLYFRRGSMQVTKSVFSYIPVQDWSKSWTDAELYAKYNLTQDEIDFIESMIKPME